MRAWIVVIGLLLAPSLADAQQGYPPSYQEPPPSHRSGRRTELTAQLGWQWGGTQDYYAYQSYAAGEFHANAAMNYGGALTAYVRPDYAVEIQYSYQSTELEIRPSNFSETVLGDLSVHYILLQGVRAVPIRPGVEGIGFGGLGAAIFDADGFDSHTVFAFTAGLGAKFNAGEKMGIRIQSRMLIPTQWGGGGFYFGTGGSGVSVSGGSTLLQGDVSIGLVMRLGQ